MAEDQLKLVVIGGSAGSLDVLLKVLPNLRTDFSIPIVIILHRKTSNDDLLVHLLSTRTTLIVKEAEEKESITPHTIYIAPADYHLLCENEGTLSLDDSEKVNYSRPSIDVSFQSFARCFKENLVAIILSGANADGTEGVKTIKENNGVTLAQIPEEASVSFMPKNAISGGTIDHVFTTDEMILFLNSLQ
jgi:two-component system chemotaxis response regulator CheB